jgi:hypothetical protein
MLSWGHAFVMVSRKPTHNMMGKLIELVQTDVGSKGNYQAISQFEWFHGNLVVGLLSLELYISAVTNQILPSYS